MNREEQIKMWEMAAGKMGKTGEKFGTGGPKKPEKPEKPVTDAAADAKKITDSAAAHAAARDEHLRKGTYHS